MKKLIASLILLCASAARAQIIDFAYHLTASAYPLDGGVSTSGSSVGPYSGTPVLGDMIYFNGTNWVSLAAPANGAYNVTWTTSVPSWTAATAGAPTGATYITQVAESGLSAEQALGSLATGFMKSATTTGVVSTQPTITLPDLATQAATTFVMNNTTGTAAPTAVAVQAAQQSLALDTSYMYMRDEMCTVGGVFRSQATGGGTVLENTTDLSTAHPCVAIFTSGTGTTDGFAYVMTDSGNVDATVKLGGGAIVIKWAALVTTLSDGTNTFVASAGLFTSKNVFTDGVWVDYAQATDTHWRFCGSKASASSCSNTTVTVNAGQWYRFELDINAAGTAANLLIDGVAAGSNLTGTNIPTAGIIPILEIQKSAGGSSRNISWDYFIYFQALTATR